MFTKFTAALMAGALALASAAAPTEVRAGNDTGKIVAGLAIGAIIGAAIANDNKKRRYDDGYVSRQGYDAYGYSSNQDRHRGYNRGYGSRRVSLPGACRVYNGYRSGYSGRCLSGYNYGYDALPSACAVRVGGRHGTIYRDRCLNRYGYR
ncbi:MAG: hypothetical protein ACU0AX_09790 [Roseovarius sp.]|uniref:hypothetical protein n=1 Tax=Roseovarius sp. TaxID=1486281 RepID=UPI00405841EF